MCICLNCKRLNYCEIYSIVEQKHGEKQNNIQILFSPQSPILTCINFFSKKNSYTIEWDVNECLSYQENPGSWLIKDSIELDFSSYLSFDLLF
uniref:hypothetical protein n=1 Tax=Desmarestia aculeata TaxID=62298 RepID=UPI002E76E7A9|nr:hypothetical protein V2483_pgp063 [Desmarestia aculeata]WAM62913.1 hypothetical protein [Desmarestia aculeata]